MLVEIAEAVAVGLVFWSSLGFQSPSPSIPIHRPELFTSYGLIRKNDSGSLFHE